MPVEHIKVSAAARDQLITLKRRTGIENWNTLCRWAFCTSLAEPNPPPDAKHPADSNIEMSWRTFAGGQDEIYWALLKQRCAEDGIDPNDEEALATQFRLHLHRGISYLAGDRQMSDVSDLVARVGRTKQHSR